MGLHAANTGTRTRKAAMEYRVDFSGVQWETPMRGVRHKAVKHGARLLRLVEYTDDLEPHWCEKGHIGYLLEGRFEITFDSGVYEFRPGDGIFIPPGPEHRHMGRALSKTVKVIFVEDV